MNEWGVVLDSHCSAEMVERPASLTGFSKVLLMFCFILGKECACVCV